MFRFLKRLFGIKSQNEIWRECVIEEALSRGLAPEPVVKDGVLRGYNLVDPSGKQKPMFVSAYR